MNRQLSNYTTVLKELKQKIRRARLRAALNVNAELLRVYWEIGKAILEQQKKEGWGTKVIDRLTTDLKMEFPDMKGLSVRNIKYMRAFAEAWPQFVQQVAAQLHDNIEYSPSDFSTGEQMQQAAAQLPWGHHQILLDKVKTQKERLFYINQCVQNSWSRHILAEQIESGLINRQGKSLNNFGTTLHAIDSDLATETFKNPYVFDFLTLNEEAKEKDLERALIQHLKKFMLELGKGFAYVGNQYNLDVNGDDYFLDLLFYNYHLHCFVVFELKIGEFKPEYAGKLNFYINTLNKQVRSKDDKPTIGVLLCKTPNETVIKYSLAGIAQPMGVADYKLAIAVPKNLKGELPTIEELEKELKEETERFEKPVDKKLNQLKELVKSLKQPKVREERNAATSKKVFSKVVLVLRDQLKSVLAETAERFKKTEYLLWMDNQGFHSDKEAKTYLAKHNTFSQYRIEIRMDGFIDAGTKAFRVNEYLYFHTNQFSYSIGLEYNSNKGIIIPEKLYHELPAKKEMAQITDAVHEKILDEIIRHIELIKQEKN